MSQQCNVLLGEKIAKGDAVCVTDFDTANKRPTVKRATHDNLATSKTVFGIAENDSVPGDNASVESVFVLVTGEVAENDITLLGAGASRIIVTDFSNPEVNKQCRLKRIDNPQLPDSSKPFPGGFSEGFVVGTCDEKGNLIIQPRHSSYETGFVKAHNVRAYGAVSDWNGTKGTDNLDAFNKAIQAAANDYQDSTYPIKIVADGWFYLSNTLHIPRGIILEGSGNGDPTHRPGTMLVFPANVTGIRIHSNVDNDIPPELTVTGVGGALSQIRNLTVHCNEKRGYPPLRDGKVTPPYGFNGHGIHSSITCVIRDVTVTNFAENGIWIEAADPRFPGAKSNAAGTHIINTNSNDNGAHGFHFIGFNANVCLIEMCYADENWGNGFREEGGSGNTYVACFGQGNLGERAAYPDGAPIGFDKDDKNHDFYVVYDDRNKSNQSTFFGCYSEGSIDHIYAPAGAIGGGLSEGTFAADSNGFSLSSGGIVNIGPLITEYKFDPDGPRVEIGDCTKNNRALTFQARKDELPVDFLYFVYRPTIEPSAEIQLPLNWWEFQSNNVSRSIVRFPTARSEVRQPAPWMPNGLFIGMDDPINLNHPPIHMTAALSLPKDLTYDRGDIVWGTQPAAGESIGQVCITGGTQMSEFPLLTDTELLKDDTTVMLVSSSSDDYWLKLFKKGQYVTIGDKSDVYKVTKIPLHNQQIEISPGAAAVIPKGALVAFTSQTVDIVKKDDKTVKVKLNKDVYPTVYSRLMIGQYVTIGDAPDVYKIGKVTSPTIDVESINPPILGAQVPIPKGAAIQINDIKTKEKIEPGQIKITVNKTDGIVVGQNIIIGRGQDQLGNRFIYRIINIGQGTIDIELINPPIIGAQIPIPIGAAIRINGNITGIQTKEKIEPGQIKIPIDKTDGIVVGQNITIGDGQDQLKNPFVYEIIKIDPGINPTIDIKSINPPIIGAQVTIAIGIFIQIDGIQTTAEIKLGNTIIPIDKTDGIVVGQNITIGNGQDQLKNPFVYKIIKIDPEIKPTIEIESINEPIPRAQTFIPIGTVIQIADNTVTDIETVANIKPGETIAIDITDGIAVGQNITFVTKDSKDQKGDPFVYKIIKIDPGTIEILDPTTGRPTTAKADVTAAKAIQFSPAVFSTFGTVENIGKSTSYSANQTLKHSDRYVSVTVTELTMILPDSPRDGQTHSIKSKAGVSTKVIASTAATGDVLIDGTLTVVIESLENRTFRYSIATKEWEIR